MAGRLSDPPFDEPEDAGRTALGAAGAEVRAALAIFDRGRLPAWALVRQRLDATEVGDVPAAMRAALDPVIAGVRPGARVAIAAGSRGIDRIDEVVRALVARLREAGADVFVVPAMGSHGGATAQGQLRVLASLGITPATIGCEIRSSMATVELGEVQPGVPVFADRHAVEEADLVIPVNRVRPHTGFDGPIESGLLKMIAIGFGKQRGADTFHRQGFAAFAKLIPAAAELTLARVPIPFGVALLENGLGRLRHVEAVPADRILERERELLGQARATMATLPPVPIDVLVVDAIGKDVSGRGMDTNVIGRKGAGQSAGAAGPLAPGVAGPPPIKRIVVRDLTPGTEGNAAGIGLADVVLRRAVEKADFAKTYVNSITARVPEGARIPITVETDREALFVAIATADRVEPETARIVRVRDTRHMGLLLVSEPALAEVLADGRFELVASPHPITFDDVGMLEGDGLR